MPKHAPPQPDESTSRLLSNPKMLSFQLDETEADSAKKMAKTRRMPLSQWLREAAREKLEREQAPAA